MAEQKAAWAVACGMRADNRRKIRDSLAALTAALCAVAPPLCIAAAPAGGTWPNRPIRVLLPNSPGSATDILGRIAFQRMADVLGQPLLVDNRPGAGGTTGVEIGMRAQPDGYTITTVTLAVLAVAPHTFKSVGYDVFRDIQPVSVFAIAQTGVCVNAQLPVQSVRDLVELARARQGRLLMASAGIGSTSHMGGLLFTSLAKIEATHVPYKGGGPSMAAVAQGEADFTVGPIVAAMMHVKAGRTRCLATGGERRSPLYPDLPILTEAGVPGYRYSGWNGIVLPANTPRAVVDRLHGALVSVLRRDDVRQLYAAQGEEPAWNAPEAFARLIREDFDAMGKLVKAAGVRAE
jgi:tripartite-type tricarboxylate transporter receptor subunit TctC